MKPIAPLLFISLLFISAVHCKNKKKQHEPVKEAAIVQTAITGPAYNLDKPEVRQLHKRLKEISGINWLGDGKLAAEEDEDGVVYIVDFATGTINTSFSVAPPGDYEDIVTLQDNYYLLNSNGDIYKINRKAPSPATTKVFRFGKQETEFESLYLDEGGRRLIMICKTCAGNEHNSFIDAYSFDLQKETFSTTPVFAIDEAAVRRLLNIGKGKFKPSAAAIHPVEKKLYVLCSIGRLLLVCNLEGVVESASPLNNPLYTQPEGLAFAPNGDMYISNEGKETRATILKLPYLPKKK